MKLKKEPIKQNINEEEINDTVENKTLCKVCEMKYDDMIHLEIHERRYHEISYQEKCDSYDYEINDEAIIERHRNSHHE